MFSNRSKLSEYILLAPAFLLMLGFFLFVLSYILHSAFIVENGDVFTFGLNNFTDVFGNSRFINTFIRTILFVLVGTPLELILGIIFALIIKDKLPLNKFIRSISIIPFTIPTIVSAIVLLVIFDYPNGHINAILTGKYSIFPFQILDTPIDWRKNEFFSILLAMFGKIWRDLPISTFIILNGLIAISNDEIEVAKTMGAKNRDLIRYIYIPKLIQPISAVLFLRSIEFWKEFIFPYILSGRFTLLATLIEEYYHNWHMVGKASVVSLVLLLSMIITALFIKFIINKIKQVTMVI